MALAFLKKIPFFKKKRKKKSRKKEIYLRDTEVKHVLPKKQYEFSSDYFKIDGEYGSLLTLFPETGANKNLPPFWGYALLPINLGRDVSARLLNQVTVMDKAWIRKMEPRAANATKQHLDNSEENEFDRRKQRKAEERWNDMEQVSIDLEDDDTYLACEFKLLVKAPSIEILDNAVLRYQQILNHSNVIGGIHVSAYQGQQRLDMSNIFKRADLQIGNAKYFTATEFAGSYNIVSHGISDMGGELVGVTKGDINPSAVVFDVDNYSNIVVVASGAHAATLTSYQTGKDLYGKMTRSPALWGTKLAQAALSNDHRVVHFVLNESHPSSLGTDLKDITVDVSMNQGAINPFQLFGDPEDELSVYAAHAEKLRLMAKMIVPSLTDVDINKTFTKILSEFYRDLSMLVENPQVNRAKLRLVGLPNEQYPLLKRFNVYLTQAYTEALKRHNQSEIDSIQRLQGAFEKMHNDDGDLFNVVTSNVVNSVSRTPQVVYDFSSLRRRGNDIAMAQFINALGYATGRLKPRDLIIIHGADLIGAEVKDYVDSVITDLRRRDVRVAYLYDDVEACLNDHRFNHLVDADWTLFGPMTTPNLNLYQEILETPIPQSIAKSLEKAVDTTYFLHRDIDNIVFDLDFIL